MRYRNVIGQIKERIDIAYIVAKYNIYLAINQSHFILNYLVFMGKIYRKCSKGRFDIVTLLNE